MWTIRTPRSCASSALSGAAARWNVAAFGAGCSHSRCCGCLETHAQSAAADMAAAVNRDHAGLVRIAARRLRASGHALIDGNVLGALAPERFLPPIRPSMLETQARDARHEIQFRRPDIAERDRIEADAALR